MSSPIKLLVFAGTSRAASFNRRLAAAAAEMGRADGAAVTHLELADFELPLYDPDAEAAHGMPLSALRLKEIFYAHPAWIICSPEYHGSCTPLLSNTLAWLSRPVPGHPEWAEGLRPSEGKVVGLLSASPGGFGGVQGLNQLAPMLTRLQCWVAPHRYALGKADEAFDPDGQLATDAQRRGVRAVVDQVLWAARRLHHAP